MAKAAIKNFARNVKVAFAHREISMAEWARRNGHRKNTVSRAVRGLRNGKLSRLIRKQLEEMLDA